MKRNLVFFISMFFLVPAVCFASGSGDQERGVFAGIARLEGRGISNLLLFPLEWGHFPKEETRGGIGYVPALITHTTTRIFSGISDMLFMPLIYPFSKYDDSIPEGMGWGEFPWQKPQEF